METAKSVPFGKKSKINIARCILKSAKNNINYNTNSSDLPPTCTVLHAAGRISMLTHFNFLSFNFLWGRLSHLRCLNEETRHREGEGLAQAHTAAKWPRMECAPRGRRGAAEPTQRLRSLGRSRPRLPQTSAEDAGLGPVVPGPGPRALQGCSGLGRVQEAAGGWGSEARL